MNHIVKISVKNIDHDMFFYFDTFNQVCAFLESFQPTNPHLIVYVNGIRKEA